MKIILSNEINKLFFFCQLDGKVFLTSSIDSAAAFHTVDEAEEMLNHISNFSKYINEDDDLEIKKEVLIPYRCGLVMKFCKLV